MNRATTTNLKGAVKDFSVDLGTIDTTQQAKGDTWYDFPMSAEYLGYYKTIPELKSAIDTLNAWTIGKGVETDIRTEIILENMTGWGEDSFLSIMKNLFMQMKVLGDSFAEIIRGEDGEMINLKPLYTGDMRTVVNAKGRIVRYELRTNGESGKHKVFQPNEILHLVNNRIGNEIHGTGVVESAKWVIDARNEAMSDERKIKHRDLAMGILYVDSDNATKRDALVTQYENAVKNGEVLVLPKDTAELKDTKVTAQERLRWIQYLEGFFYQIVGVPPAIANPKDFTEAAAKTGFMTFEPIYTAEQTELEADIWNQLALRVKFNRPPSLHGVVSEDEKKNTGQVGIQPNEVTAQAGRVE